jgi:hypothetical protein
MPGYRLYRPFGTASQHRPSSVFRKSDHTIILKLKQISSYLLGNLLDRVLALVTEAAGKSNRHIHRAYVPANHLCRMWQMASARLIADADYLGTSHGT